MSFRDLRLCPTCAQLLKAYYRHRDNHGELVPEDDRESFTMCDECVSANTAAAFTIGTQVQLLSWRIEDDPEEDNRVGVITGIKQPNHTDSPCISYGVQFPVTGGQLVSECDLVLIELAAKHFAVAAGVGWIQAIECDSLEAANEWVTSLRADRDCLGHATPADAVSITDENGEIVETFALSDVPG